MFFHVFFCVESLAKKGRFGKGRLQNSQGNGKTLTQSPRKLTWNLKMMVSNRNLFQGFIFRFHVSFPGCRTTCEVSINALSKSRTSCYNKIWMWFFSKGPLPGELEKVFWKTLFPGYFEKMQNFWRHKQTRSDFVTHRCFKASYSDLLGANIGCWRFPEMTKLFE